MGITTLAQKAHRIADSCHTVDQLIVARRWVVMAMRREKSPGSYYALATVRTKITNLIEEGIKNHEQG